ncbi:ATP-dependent DNA helicase MPH1 isoform X2 [Drosophila guanche]|uniref:Blast:Fanconi anemia group M protein n=1 Tax=Drosophila guanche TaxID=7266 RepID=A0A3B0JDA1_DROGU|nr:ATP-dependent DNA helicase MPH1 isoform X2 [Drosophila guanche]SPP80367.1 blast:Fanconi anemia group M protein [Drosophila guanche]
MDVDWNDNDEDLVAALEIHELLESNDQSVSKPQEPSSHAEDECHGFDMATGHNWIYPNNLPLRAYQQTIVQAALYKNTLVVLPTGLGKTFIAAVVMYNFYRWYPQGKIIFMAPTRPLVAQQIAACQKIMPFPSSDTVQLTGQLARAKRANLWASKRVFFATPQVVHSDMLETEDGSYFPFSDIKLLVVDEAHRAKGRYAFTQVADCMMAHNRNFRMLALSATPGRTIEDVSSVCQNLYIANLQVRWDNSIDVQPYVHKRIIRTIVVSVQEKIKETRERLLQIIEPYLRQLIAADVLKGTKGNISKNNLLYDQKAFNERSARGQRHPEHNIIAGNFAVCISLYHSLELMERHGLRVFVNNFDADEDGREKFVLARDRDLRNLIDQVRMDLGTNPLDYTTHAMTNGELPPMPADLDFGHAKYERLRQVLVEHFTSHADSRAIVFCEYRESVMLIHRLLLQHRPLLRARCFVGQGSTAGSSYALTQKQQIQIMADFRSGTSNVLVATSIGEEGIDVGEVEMIVCFDICSSNPTRFVQRIGRTGRKKNGEVVMLVTEGREHQVLRDVLANKDQTNKKLLNSSVVRMSLYANNPRMVPAQFQPKCEETHMEAAALEEKPKTNAKTKERKQPKPPSVTLHKFFKPSSQGTQSQEGILQGFEPYQMSKESQQMIQAEVSGRGVSVKNFFLDTQATATLSNSQEDVQRLRKLTRLLQSNKPIVSASQDLVSHLQDKELPRPLKLYLLRSNPDFVQETHSKMLNQIQMNIPEQRLNGRQQRTRNNYQLLLDVCEGPDNLEELLQSEPSLAEITLKDLEGPLDEQTERDFRATCDKIFDGLDEEGLNSDNFELKQQLLDKLELRNLEATVHEQFRVDEDSWSDDEFEQDLEKECNSMYQSQWLDFAATEAVQHKSTPLRAKPESRAKFDALEEEEEGDSRVEASDLGDNLGRLNCLMSVAKTEPTEATVASATAEVAQSSPSDLQAETNVSPEPVTTQEDELGIDLNDFLEPMDEEVELISQQKRDTLLPCDDMKENLPYAPKSCSTPRNVSPDIFGSDSMSPFKPQPKSLAAKLAAKTSSAAATDSSPSKAFKLQSPEHRKRTTPSAPEKSPSIFDLYLNRVRGRGRMAKAAQSLHQQTSVKASAPSNLAKVIEEDSPIIRRSSKRKIVISSDEEERQKSIMQVPATQADFDTDEGEAIPATQMETPPTKPRQKRRRFNSFIMDEADKSGSDHDEEAETTIGAYLKDSVVVSSDDEHHNNTTDHAMYLQAIRSPVQRPGAFKIPARRVYHDESHIFSQAVETEASQYMPSSFVVDDDTLSHEKHDISECPLERAERILKERRRQRRLGIEVPPPASNKRRRVHRVESSSDDDDVICLD